MGSVNIVVFIESFRTIIMRESDEERNALHLASLIEVSAAWGTPSPSSLPFPFLTPWHALRHQAFAFLVLPFPAQAVQPGSGLVGGPQERLVDQWLWYGSRVDLHVLLILTGLVWEGVIMSAGGSKIIWCTLLPHFLAARMTV